MAALIVPVVLVLIAVNALYVAAEFSAVSVRRSRIRQLAAEGSLLARQLLPVLEDPYKLDRYIAACQVGITISSLVLGAYGQATLPGRISPAFEGLGGLGEPAAHSASAVAVLFFLTGVQVLIGELVPKSVALQYPARVALITAIPMRWSLVAFSWFIAVLNGSGLAILRLLRAGGSGHGHIHSPDEIELLIVQSADGGLLQASERRRLGRALSLSTRDARNVMIPRNHIEFIDYDDPIAEILDQVARSPFTRLPAFRDSTDNVIGVVHTRDLVLRAMEGPLGSIDDILRPVATVPDTMSADRVLATLREHGAQQAMVIDEFGGVAGLVTLEDILSDVFGEFADEFKGVEEEPAVLPDGRLRLHGRMQLDDATAITGFEWGGHADTVGGLVTEILERLPEPGERVAVGPLEVEVEAVAHHAVSSVLVRLPQPGDEEEPEDG